jgi:hypothetical protein
VGLGLTLDLTHCQLGAGGFDARWRAAAVPGDDNNVLFADVDVSSSACCALAVASESEPSTVRLCGFELLIRT